MMQRRSSRRVDEGNDGRRAADKIQQFLRQQAADPQQTQQLLMARLVSSDPTKPVPKHVRPDDNQRSTRSCERADKPHTLPAITIERFHEKYCAHDALLRYALHVIQQRLPLTDGWDDVADAKRTVVPEDDVLYLVYDESPPSGFKNVYWLQFTEELRVINGLEEYFTLSSHGFTRVRRGIVLEYADVATWVDEKRAFDHMTNMKGLQKIQQMLFFFSWKKKAIKSRHRRIGAVLDYFLVSEAIHKHLSTFISCLHHAVCGVFVREEHRTAIVTETTEEDTQQASEPPPVIQLTTKLHQMEAIELATNPVVYDLRFHLRHRTTPHPFIYAEVVESINLNAHGFNDDSLMIQPSKFDVLGVLHKAMKDYLVAMDDIRCVLQDPRFASVLAPFAPHQKREFLENMSKPSSNTLQMKVRELKDMRQALDIYVKQLEILASDHKAFVSDLQRANQVRIGSVRFGGELSSESLPLTSAERYEVESVKWEGFLERARKTPTFVQIGVVLINQQSIQDKVRAHIANQVNRMDQLLPLIYKQFLQGIIGEVECLLERVTNIPTTMSDALTWLQSMIEMLPNHPFRLAFDTKCKNVDKLRLLLKERVAKSSTSELPDYGAVRKLEYAWESLHETFILCLQRVQDRDSEHRQSFQALVMKSEASVTRQLEQIRDEFEQVPSGVEASTDDKKKQKQIEMKKKTIVQQLEQLAEVDVERENLVALFSEFECRHRACVEGTTSSWDADLSSSSHPEKKLLTESFLGYVVTSFDLMKWFGSWRELEQKWLCAPLHTVHSGVVMNRIKQFRRRLLHGTSKLNHAVNVNFADAAFLTRDAQLVQTFERSLDNMLENCKVFQAISSGAFSEERWSTVEQLLEGDSSITESKVHSRIEQVRQRLGRLQMEFKHENYRIRLENISIIVRDLEDLSMELKLVASAHNPWLESLLELIDDVETKLSMCSNIKDFQEKWFLLCEMSKLHDVEEFFSGQSPIKSRKSRQSIARQDSTWVDFLSSSNQWGDRVRCLSCMSINALVAGPPRSSLSHDANANPSLDKFQGLPCTLDQVLEVFKGFEFEKHTRYCEDAEALFRAFLRATRERTPRLFLLQDVELLRLLIREDDLNEIKRTLVTCFPQVASFMLASTTRKLDVDSDEPGSGSGISSSLGSIESDGVEYGGYSRSGSLVLRGISDQSGTQFQFGVEVMKIGRVKFWLSRVEEEIANLVKDHTKKALQTVLQEEINVKDSLFQRKQCNLLLPQCIVVALTARFTHEVIHGIPFMANDDESEEAISPLDKIDELIDNALRWQEQIVDFITNPSNGFHKGDTRVESALALSLNQCTSLRHTRELAGQDMWEEAKFHWLTHLRVHVYLDTQSSNSSKLIRLTQLSLPEIAASIQSRPFQLIAQVAHMEIPLGKDFAGCERLPVLSPLTNRCAFALFSAMRNCSLALVAPYSTSPTASTHLVRAISHFLMKLVLTLDSAKMANNLENVENYARATYSLNGMLVCPRPIALAPATMSAFYERLKEMFEDTIARQSSGSLASQRASTVNAVVFFPCSSSEIQQSQLMRSLQTPWRPLAVVPPSLEHFVDVCLLTQGYTRSQIDSINLTSCLLELFDALPAQLPNNFHFAQKVVQEVAQLKNASHVSSLDSPSSRSPDRRERRERSAGIGRVALAALRNADESLEHALFSKAITMMVRRLSSSLEDSTQNSIATILENLMTKYFPLAKQRTIAEKPLSKENAVLDAVKICLSHMNLGVNEHQLKKTMELWKAIDGKRASIVTGGIALGKSTCIKTLHNALCALELAEIQELEAVNEDDAAEKTTISSQTASGRAQYVVINHHLLTLDEMYGINADLSDPQMNSGLLPRLLRSTDVTHSQASHRVWLHFDGVPKLAMLEPLLSLLRSGYTRMMLPSSGLIQVAAMQDTQVVFEASDLTDLSPTLLYTCSMVVMEATCVRMVNILAAWRSAWEDVLQFPVGSRAAENTALVFRTVHFLISEVCVQYIAEDPTVRSQHSDPNEPIEEQELRLGLLSICQMTQTALSLVSAMLLKHRTTLEDMTGQEITRCVLFAVLWGFAGHLDDMGRQKIDHFVRARVQNRVELRHLGDVQGSSLDCARLGDFWVKVHGANQSLVSKTIKATQDATTNAASNVLVLPPSALSMVQICRLYIHSGRSFILVGPRACGKTSFLRILCQLNEEDEANEAMVETSIHERHAHGILNWMHMPPAFFDPRCANSSAMFVRAECDLSNVHGQTTFVFLDDVGLTPGGEGHHQAEFLRQVLHHRSMYSRTRHAIVPVNKQVGATMSIREEQQGPTTYSIGDSLSRSILRMAVLRACVHDRKELQHVFRTKYHAYFPPISATKPTAPPLRSEGDRTLSLEETILRANVDFAVDMIAIAGAQTQPGTSFLFNLHHLDDLLVRLFRFEMGDTYRPREASLLALGRLHQSWMSQARHIAYIPWSNASGSSRSLVQDKADPNKRLWSCIRLISDKYFSVALRNDMDAMLAGSTVYFAHEVLSHRMKEHRENVLSVLNEALIGNASSMSLTRGKGSTGDMAAGVSRETCMQLIVQALMRVIEQHGALETRWRTQLMLVLANTRWLDRLLQLIHALDLGKNLMISTNDPSIVRMLVRIAALVLHARFTALSMQDETQTHEALTELVQQAVVHDKQSIAWLGVPSAPAEMATKSLAAWSAIVNAGCRKHAFALFRDAPVRDAITSAVVRHTTRLESIDQDSMLDKCRALVAAKLRTCICTSEPLSAFEPWPELECIQGLRFDSDQLGLLEMANAAIAMSSLSLVQIQESTLGQTLVTIHSQLYSHSQAYVSEMAAFLQFLENAVVLSREKENKRSQKRATIARCMTKVEEIREQFPKLHMEKSVLEKRVVALTREVRVSSAAYASATIPSAFEELDDVAPIGQRTQWILRVRMEESSLALAECEQRLSDLSVDIKEWQDASAAVAALGSMWNGKLAVLESDGPRQQALALLQSAEMTYLLCLPSNERRRHRQALCSTIGVKTCPDPVEYLHALEEWPTFATNESIHCHVWQARFPFLQSESVAELLSVDYLSDQVPVFVDPTGLMQHLLVACLAARMFQDDDPEHHSNSWNDPSNELGAVVINCDDQAVDFKLRLAQQRNVPVLLVNFEATVIPIVTSVLGDTPPLRRPHTLHEMTMFGFEQHQELQAKRRSVQQRRRILSSAVTPGAGIASLAKSQLGRIKVNTKPTTVVSSPLSSPSSPTPGSSSALLKTKSFIAAAQTKAHQRFAALSFQIFAVTTRVQTLASLRGQPGVIGVSVDWADEELDGFFRNVWIRKCNATLAESMFEHKHGVISNLVAMAALRDQARTAFGGSRCAPAIHTLAAIADTMHREERKQRSQLFLCSQRQAEIDKECAKYSRIGQEVHDLMTSLLLLPLAPCFPRSYQWLAQQVVMQVDIFNSHNGSSRRLDLQLDPARIFDVVYRELTIRVLSGVSSGVLRSVLQLLVALRRASRDDTVALGEQSFQKFIDLLSSSPMDHMPSGAQPPVAAQSPPTQADNPSQATTTDSSVEPPLAVRGTLAERLRRKIRLCAHFFGQMETSRGVTNESTKATRQRTHRSRMLAGANQDFAPAKSTSKAKAPASAESQLSVAWKLSLERDVAVLQQDLESLWCDWKAAAMLLKRDLERDLDSMHLITYRRRRSSASGESLRAFISSGSSSVNPIVVLALQSLPDVDRAYHPDTGNESATQRVLRQLILSKTWFPSAFFDVAQTVIAHNAVTTIKARGAQITPVLIETLPATVLPSTHADLFVTSEGRVHLPVSLVVYAPRERHLVEIALTNAKEVSGAHVISVNRLNAGRLKEEILPAVTSKAPLIVEITDASHFDEVLLVVSKVINQNALLSIPRWRMVCSSVELERVHSGRLPFVHVVTALDAESTSLIQTLEAMETSLDRMITDNEIARQLMVKYSSLLLGEPQEMLPIAPSLALCSEVDEVAASAAVEQDGKQHQELIAGIGFDNCFVQRDDARRSIILGKQTSSESVSGANAFSQPDVTSTANSAAMSASLLNALYAMAPKNAELQLPTQFVGPFERMAGLIARLRAHQATGQPPTFTEGLFVPWCSCLEEFEANAALFDLLSGLINALRRNLLETQRSVETMDLVRTIQRGFVPAVWIDAIRKKLGSDLTSRSTPLMWPPAHVSFVQLLVLLYCRLRLVTAALCMRGGVAFNLAAICNAANVLEQLQEHVSRQSRTSRDRIHLLLELDDATDGASDMLLKANTGQTVTSMTSKAEVPPSYHPAVLIDSDGPIGIRLQGLALLEIVAATTHSDMRTNAHILPLCRLTCVTDEELRRIEKQVGKHGGGSHGSGLSSCALVLVPSLGVYQDTALSSDITLTIANRLFLGRSIADTFATLLHSIESPVPREFSICAPLFPEEDEPERV
ncbi:TPA: hypothetical protein N0F65_004270 [Lagenidium giganteum]|uniref:Dynein heavy chain n=1 Tax=Lagenidium giganteum TaxID=4803 RepID=A0AAV2ZBL4_9STRA|nr:TPA: hypothetical protein N0F65_004270 [Lagenidium giganteum]